MWNCVYVVFWIRMQNVEVPMNFPYLLNSCEKANTIIRLGLSRQSKVSSNNATISSPTDVKHHFVHYFGAYRKFMYIDWTENFIQDNAPLHRSIHIKWIQRREERVQKTLHLVRSQWNGLNLIKQSVGWVHMMLFNRRRT